MAVTVLARVIAVAGLVCFILAGTELLSRARRGATDFETVCLGVVLSWLLVPILLDTIFSLAYRSIFNSSFLLQSVPAGALTIAFVVGKLLPKAVSNLTAVALTALLLAALIPTYGVSYEQWAQASRYIARAAQSGDCLTVNKPGLASISGSTSPHNPPLPTRSNWPCRRCPGPRCWRLVSAGQAQTSPSRPLPQGAKGCG